MVDSAGHGPDAAAAVYASVSVQIVAVGEVDGFGSRKVAFLRVVQFRVLTLNVFGETVVSLHEEILSVRLDLFIAGEADQWFFLQYKCTCRYTSGGEQGITFGLSIADFHHG